MQNPLEEFTKPQKAPTAKAMPPEQLKALVKKIVIFDFVFVLPLVAFFVFSDMSGIDREKPSQQAAPTTKTKPATQKEVQLYVPTIEQAYKNNGVQRVKFDPSISKLAYDEKEYFTQLFEITDRLVIERVYNSWATYYKKPLRDVREYDIALAEMAQMNVPSSATKAHELVVEAVKSQRDYHKFLSDTGGDFNVGNPLVQATHSKLIAAWQIWLHEYDKEEGKNKLAFEKHLCALDFI